VAPEDPTKSPAAIVEELEQKIAEERSDPARQDRGSEAAEDADPTASGIEANTIEPPD
jgi:hypothetical protein